MKKRTVIKNPIKNQSSTQKNDERLFQVASEDQLCMRSEPSKCQLSIQKDNYPIIEQSVKEQINQNSNINQYTKCIKVLKKPKSEINTNQTLSRDNQEDLEKLNKNDEKIDLAIINNNIQSQNKEKKQITQLIDNHLNQSPSILQKSEKQSINFTISKSPKIVPQKSILNQKQNDEIVNSTSKAQQNSNLQQSGLKDLLSQSERKARQQKEQKLSKDQTILVEVIPVSQVKNIQKKAQFTIEIPYLESEESKINKHLVKENVLNKSFSSFNEKPVIQQQKQSLNKSFSQSSKNFSIGKKQQDSLNQILPQDLLQNDDQIDKQVKNIQSKSNSNNLFYLRNDPQSQKNNIQSQAQIKNGNNDYQVNNIDKINNQLKKSMNQTNCYEQNNEQQKSQSLQAKMNQKLIEKRNNQQLSLGNQENLIEDSTEKNSKNRDDDTKHSQYSQINNLVNQSFKTAYQQVKEKYSSQNDDQLNKKLEILKNMQANQKKRREENNQKLDMLMDELIKLNQKKEQNSNYNSKKKQKINQEEEDAGKQQQQQQQQHLSQQLLELKERYLNKIFQQKSNQRNQFQDILPQSQKLKRGELDLNLQVRKKQQMNSFENNNFADQQQTYQLLNSNLLIQQSKNELLTNSLSTNKQKSIEVFSRNSANQQQINKLSNTKQIVNQLQVKDQRNSFLTIDKDYQLQRNETLNFNQAMKNQQQVHEQKKQLAFQDPRQKEVDNLLEDQISIQINPQQEINPQNEGQQSLQQFMMKVNQSIINLNKQIHDYSNKKDGNRQANYIEIDTEDVQTSQQIPFKGQGKQSFSEIQKKERQLNQNNQLVDNKVKYILVGYDGKETIPEIQNEEVNNQRESDLKMKSSSLQEQINTKQDKQIEEENCVIQIDSSKSIDQEHMQMISKMAMMDVEKEEKKENVVAVNQADNQLLEKKNSIEFDIKKINQAIKSLSKKKLSFLKHREKKILKLKAYLIRQFNSIDLQIKQYNTQKYKDILKQKQQLTEKRLEETLQKLYQQQLNYIQTKRSQYKKSLQKFQFVVQNEIDFDHFIDKKKQKIIDNQNKQEQKDTSSQLNDESNTSQILNQQENQINSTKNISNPENQQKTLENNNITEQQDKHQQENDLINKDQLNENDTRSMYQISQNDAFDKLDDGNNIQIKGKDILNKIDEEIVNNELINEGNVAEKSQINESGIDQKQTEEKTNQDLNLRDNQNGDNEAKLLNDFQQEKCNSFQQEKQLEEKMQIEEQCKSSDKIYADQQIIQQDQEQIEQIQNGSPINMNQFQSQVDSNSQATPEIDAKYKIINLNELNYLSQNNKLHSENTKQCIQNRHFEGGLIQNEQEQIDEQSCQQTLAFDLDKTQILNKQLDQRENSGMDEEKEEQKINSNLNQEDLIQINDEDLFFDNHSKNDQGKKNIQETVIIDDLFEPENKTIKQKTKEYISINIKCSQDQLNNTQISQQINNNQQLQQQQIFEIDDLFSDQQTRSNKLQETIKSSIELKDTKNNNVILPQITQKTKEEDKTQDKEERKLKKKTNHDFFQTLIAMIKTCSSFGLSGYHHTIYKMQEQMELENQKKLEEWLDQRKFEDRVAITTSNQQFTFSFNKHPDNMQKQVQNYQNNDTTYNQSENQQENNQIKQSKQNDGFKESLPKIIFLKNFIIKKKETQNRIELNQKQIDCNKHAQKSSNSMQIEYEKKQSSATEIASSQKLIKISQQPIKHFKIIKK